MSSIRVRLTHHHLPLLALLSLLLLAGCAEVTRPQPTAAEHEELQLAATRRHPPQSWALERTSRVFLKLLATVPQVHGRTYPFLGFNWWVTARDQIVIDRVWRPSPAQDAGLKPGDLILAAHNWPLSPWVADADRHLHTIRGMCGGLPGEFLVSLLLTVKYVGLDLREQYLRGPVELLVQRGEKKWQVTLYPQHLPANYAILVATRPGVGDTINAWAAPGRIIISRRYVSFCRTDDELALIIGHELAHHILGHRTRRAGQSQLTWLVGDTVGAFATYTLDYLLRLWYLPLGERELFRAVPQATLSAYSRGDEREADAYGMWYAFQAGYDIQGGLAVMERLAAVVEKDPFYRTSFLDTHPASLERMARMQKIARYFQAGQAAQVFLQSARLDKQPAP